MNQGLPFSQSSASIDNKEVLLNYTPVDWTQLATASTFIAAASQPLNKPYVKLTALSGNAGAGGASYVVKPVNLPAPGTSFGYIRRALFSFRFNYGFKDAALIIPGNGVELPSFILSNLSSGMTIYGGFNATDFFSFYYESGSTQEHALEPYGAIKQACVPFYANQNDNVELCLIQPCDNSHTQGGHLSLQLANFDIPLWDDFSVQGWVDNTI